MLAIIEGLLGKFSKRFYRCYKVHQIDIGSKNGNIVTMSVETRTCPSGLEVIEIGNFHYYVTDSPLFPGKSQSKATEPPDGSHGQKIEPYNHWVPFKLPNE